MNFRVRINYRPQTKFAKVMFLHLSVSHLVHRGGGVHGRGVACVVGGMCRGMCMAGGVHGGGACVVVVGEHAWQGACVVGRGHMWHRACMAGGMCVEGRHAWWGHTCYAHPPDTTKYDRSMCGRYASYWNAFLFIYCLESETAWPQDGSSVLIKPIALPDV